MSTLLLFTTGVSLLENLRDPKKFQRTATWVDRLESESFYGKSAWQYFLKDAHTCRDDLIRYAKHFALLNLNDKQQRAKTTAEIASFYLIQKPKLTPPVRLVLLCSDTGQGAFCALVNAMLLGKQVRYAKDIHTQPEQVSGFQPTEVGGFHPTIDAIRQDIVDLFVIKDLNPNDAKIFQNEAIGNLVETIATLHYAPPSAQRETILNYTGGFKAAIPTLTQVVALTGGIKLVCLYENGEELLKQPLISIGISQKARNHLLTATGQNLSTENVLHKYSTLSSLWKNLERDEWAYYETNQAGQTPALKLSTLGQAVQIVLQTEARILEQRQ